MIDSETRDSSRASARPAVCKISPSIMCADFVNLRSQLDALKEMGVEYVHIDIMDGHYVPNFTLGPDFCRAVARYAGIPLDIHLMIEDPDAYAPVFAEAARDTPDSVICFHPETSRHPLRTASFIRSLGVRCGVAVDPAMPPESVRYILPDVDLVCIMTVNPGYAGQKLVPQALDKIREIADHVQSRGLAIEIEVDGNVSWENIPRMAAAGANVFVAGTSSVFEKGADLRQTIKRFRALLEPTAA